MSSEYSVLKSFDLNTCHEGMYFTQPAWEMKLYFQINKLQS